MSRDYQKEVAPVRTLVLPVSVTVVMAELAAEVQEGLLALAVGTGPGAHTTRCG